MTEKAISPGELDNVCRAVPIEDLIDRESGAYKKRGMAYMDFDIREELLEDSLLLKMPIVRFGSLATVGCKPDIWKEWISRK